MADEESPPSKAESAAEAAPAKPAPRRKAKASPKAETPPKEAAPAKPAAPKEEHRIPRRADLPNREATLLRARRDIASRRPIFGRQARYRYFRIGRDGAWRRPRGLQSKQRRHYGYRPRIVRVGYRSPARVRGLVPSGFRPVLVHTAKELGAMDARRDAAVIARTVGTRRRLVLEEEARKLGIRVLNPIVKSEKEA